MSKPTIKERFDRVELGLDRIGQGIENVDRLRAELMLETTADQEKATHEAINALANIISALDKLTEKDRAMVFHTLIEWESTRKPAGIRSLEKCPGEAK